MVTDGVSSKVVNAHFFKGQANGKTKGKTFFLYILLNHWI